MKNKTPNKNRTASSVQPEAMPNKIAVPNTDVFSLNKAAMILRTSEDSLRTAMANDDLDVVNGGPGKLTVTFAELVRYAKQHGLRQPRLKGKKQGKAVASDAPATVAAAPLQPSVPADSQTAALSRRPDLKGLDLQAGPPDPSIRSTPRAEATATKPSGTQHPQSAPANPAADKVAPAQNDEALALKFKSRVRRAKDLLRPVGHRDLQHIVRWISNRPKFKQRKP